MLSEGNSCFLKSNSTNIASRIDVLCLREVEKAIGEINDELTKKQIQGRDFSRSLYFVKDMKKDEKISKDNIRSIRPGFGLHPSEFNKILGKSLNQDIEKGTAVNWNLINN